MKLPFFHFTAGRAAKIGALILPLAAAGPTLSQTAPQGVIPASINQNPCAHFRRPMDMIFQGWSMSLFQASQHSATISS